MPYPTPDFETFVFDVQPVVGARCAASGCHGTPQRALKLFAVDGLRLHPAQAGEAVDPDLLSDAELAWNYDALRIRLLGADRADTPPLLLKCLDPAEGGFVHADGFVVFETREDPDFRILADWIGSAP